MIGGWSHIWLILNNRTSLPGKTSMSLRSIPPSFLPDELVFYMHRIFFTGSSFRHVIDLPSAVSNGTCNLSASAHWLTSIRCQVNLLPNQCAWDVSQNEQLLKAVIFSVKKLCFFVALTQGHILHGPWAPVFLHLLRCFVLSSNLTVWSCKLSSLITLQWNL